MKINYDRIRQAAEKASNPRLQKKVTQRIAQLPLEDIQKLGNGFGDIAKIIWEKSYAEAGVKRLYDVNAAKHFIALDDAEIRWKNNFPKAVSRFEKSKLMGNKFVNIAGSTSFAHGLLKLPFPLDVVLGLAFDNDIRQGVGNQVKKWDLPVVKRLFGDK